MTVTVPVTGETLTLYYKANPVPLPPTCFDTYNEYEDEESCIFGIPIPEGDAKLAFPGYVGEANKVNHVHNTCVDNSPDSKRIQCNSGAF